MKKKNKKLGHWVSTQQIIYKDYSHLEVLCIIDPITVRNIAEGVTIEPKFEIKINNVSV